MITKKEAIEMLDMFELAREERKSCEILTDDNVNNEINIVDEFKHNTLIAIPIISIIAGLSIVLDFDINMISFAIGGGYMAILRIFE